jgi:putative membrane protein
MAAERTFLAWIRTAVALMAFGFVIARFGVILEGLGPQGVADAPDGALSLGLGLALIGVGVVVCVVSAVRHRRYVRAIDEGRFRIAFGTAFALGIAGLLVTAGLGMAVLVATMGAE